MHDQAGNIYNFCKPQGKSSFFIVKVVRAITGEKKVGHAGTLDPFADGVLLICTGRATKQVSRLIELQKEYVGTLKLGEFRDTHDITGAITESYTIPKISETKIRNVVNGFLGESEQVPPMFSARRINGQRLYKLARRGITVERPAKKIAIYEIEVIKIELPYITIRVVCSKGTYIRALARDIGKTIGCGAYLHALTRTRIGDYHVDDAFHIDSFKHWYESKNQR